MKAKYTGYVELTLTGIKKENYKIEDPFTALAKPKNLVTIDLNLIKIWKIEN